ncbi:sugar phosphate nucleotidyltransferase [Burkholderia ubonensis]|uniref:sugar phosphate nucleotidyltransferase n=1 Tax=Burkholderia ubonensis TaxID=101571 RepID=UPI000754F768|nr:sugar phosphate nucleotidyltransferase [Burkholderia ubonensis]KVT29254.1 nucleoside-diphosphate-sugar pyrophosphorylase [Burkholderia ubonensis]KVU26805.1 nucleoside-diphosphate-sugar pyrophosphorylase [Burkholderia ubonensis]KVW71629.1 nucleoside-diphosphate-sugar pyrophosphorylase [Burkholderia ubonensis]KWI36348.1 nucleoside-diphosphate-sugar pyrophosphorylase [Burkholderia ubonensis]KWK62743.1 nucleoside-diphosphate-sugar pyrophosphorylase [Burkholderia ubonensis]
MKAVVMAGGKGARLQPYTALFPKPLMPLGEMPVLELLLRQLRNAGVTDVFLAVNHLHHLIRAFCEDGSRFGLNIEYSLENNPLGTAGPLGKLIDDVGENFIVTNGDLLTTFDIGQFIDNHLTTGASATIGTYEREVKIDFGLLQTDDEMHLLGYLEKPVTKHLVSMGIYVLNRDAIRPHVQPDVYLDMPDLMKRLVAEGSQVTCHRQENSFWLDIGRPDDYALAQDMFAKQRNLFLRD